MSYAKLGKTSPLKGKQSNYIATEKHRKHLSDSIKRSWLTCRRKKLEQYMKNHNGNAFKNGTYFNKENGYIFQWVKGRRYVRQHRLVMEQILGRKLTSDEVVHHINGIRTDNRPENLKLIQNKSCHRSMHKNGETLSCNRCGKTIYRTQSHFHAHELHFCSYKCSANRHKPI